MNIAKTANEVTDAKTTTTKIYVNFKFVKFADDINNGVLPHQFDGKGRRIVLIPEQQEADYLNYSADKAGKEIIEPPFEINNGDKIKFKMQAEDGGDKNLEFKWKGIVQNRYDLKIAPGKKSTYIADISDSKDDSEMDEVIIRVNFTLNEEKFAVAWDPRVKIKK